MAVPVVPAPPVLEIDWGMPAALTPAVLPVSTAPAAVVAAPAAAVAPAVVAALLAAAAPVAAPAAGIASAAAAGDSPPPRVDRLCSGTVSTWIATGVVARAADVPAVPAVEASVAGVLPATDPRPPSVPAAEALGMGGSPHLMLSDWMFCGRR